jgi:hypothetical protein
MSICQLCKDPIWSFICPHCLAKDISMWLPERLRGAFKEFHRNLTNSFSFSIEPSGLRCLRCRETRPSSICPFCYIAEVYSWLHGRSPELAMAIRKMLPLAHDWKMARAGVAWKDGIVPVSRSEPEELDDGVCEVCERYSDELRHADGKWVCKSCESLER